VPECQPARQLTNLRFEPSESQPSRHWPSASGIHDGNVAVASAPIQVSAAGVSRVDAHVLHADDFLALMLGDGVPDGHVIGRQVQLVGTGQRVVTGKGSARAGTGSSSALATNVRRVG
jgi:hypothetical protein